MATTCKWKSTLQISNKCNIIFLLTIELLMENAIKHNVVSKDKPLIFSLEIINEEMLLVKKQYQSKIE